MNKTQYLNELRKYLKRVPSQELDDAIEYYEEYFEEAGEENEQKVIDELGAPKDLAKKIIIECVDKNFSEDYEEPSSEDSKSEKKGLSPWLILAAVFALPLSPVVLVLLLVAVILIIVAVIVLVAVFVAMGAATLVSIFAAVCGIIAIFASPSGGIMMVGVSLALAAVCAILFALTFTLFDLLIKACGKSGSKLVHKKAGAKK